MTSRRLALLALALALPTAGCGKVGDLERPGPLFGSHTPGKAPPPAPAPPVTTVDRRDLDTDADLPPLPAPGQTNADQNSTATPQ